MNPAPSARLARSLRRVTLALLVTGCAVPPATTKEDDKTTVDSTIKATDDGPKPRLASVAPLDPQRTHIVAVAHKNTDAKATVGIFAFSGRGVQPKTQVSVDAMPRADWPGHYTSVATHAGGASWIRAEPTSGTDDIAVVQADDTGKELVRVAVGVDPPAALHHVGHRILVGQGARVGLIDLSAPKPALTTLHERSGMHGKAYDIFVRDGAWLLAIDDVVTPIYADTFAITDASVKHLAAWTMPSLINGSYYAAVFAPKSPRTGTLFALARYGIMDGSGHELVALTVADGKLKVRDGVVLNQSVSTDPPVLEEHVSRQTGLPEKLVAGTEVTQWTAFAIGPAGRLLISATGRGLLVVPPDFSPTTKAEMIDMGGDCLDVVTVDGHVFVLVGDAASELVELDPRTLKPARRDALGAHYDRLL